MQAKRKTWGDVTRGKIIKAKDGVLWKVVEGKPGYWGLKTREGETKIIDMAKLGIKAGSPVDIMYLTQAECEAQLRDELGAEIYAVKYDDQGVWIFGPFEDKPIQEMKGHLLLAHGISSVSANDPGVSAGMNSKKALIECHNAQHADPGPRWTPHIHNHEDLSW